MTTTIHSVVYRVATIILSHFNDSILYQLGDIESYLASYLANHQDKMSLRASRVTPSKSMQYY